MSLYVEFNMDSQEDEFIIINEDEGVADGAKPERFAFSTPGRIKNNQRLVDFINKHMKVR